MAELPPAEAVAVQKCDKFFGLNTNDFILIMSIVFSVLCFIPMFNFQYTSIGDDYTANFNSNPTILQVSYASLIICILPGLDLLMDIVPSIIFFEFKYNASENLSPISTAVRLSKIEKLLFLVGVLSYSVVIYAPFQNLNLTSPSGAGNIFLGFENVSTILTICPIMSLLYRVSTVWTSSITLSVSFCTCMSSLLSSVCALYPTDTQTYDTIFISSCILINVATFIYTVACCLSLYSTFKWHTSKESGGGGYSDSLAHQDAINEQNFRNNVMAAHMTATFIEMVVNSVWFWMYLNLNVEQISMFIYFVLASSILTFLIEFRVRKTEVTTALVRMIPFISDLYYFTIIDNSDGSS